MEYLSYIFLQNPYVVAGAFLLTVIPGLINSYPDDEALDQIQKRPQDYNHGFLEGFNDKTKNKRLRDAVVFIAISYGLSAWFYANSFEQ